MTKKRAMPTAPPPDPSSVPTINPHIPVRWTREMMQAHFDSMTAAERAGSDAMQRAAIEEQREQTKEDA